MKQLTAAIHQVALAHKCDYRADIADGKTEYVYSKRGLKVTETGEIVTARIGTDFGRYKVLFASTKNDTVRGILYASARPCTHCISDKCTTLLMAPERTFAYDGHSKKVCSMWGQTASMTVSDENLAACLEIVDTFLAAAHPDECEDLRLNDVTYTLTEKAAFYIVGYRMRHTPVSPSDEAFVTECLPKMGTLGQALGLVAERYVGAIDNFINGAQYDFFFGIATDKKPTDVPENAVVRKIRSGEWAVYNSSASDYPSVWRHYTDRFYDLEKRGFDRSRIPFEYYDASGNWSDVHIPVDVDEPSDAGRVITFQRLPNFSVAGYERFGETDHPDHKPEDYGDVEEKLRELFPDWAMIVRGNVHQLYGKPLRGVDGVMVDDFMEIPAGVEVIPMQGGIWRLSGRRHFNGGAQDWNLDTMLDTRLPLNECQHPRSFNEYVYKARGGYSEIGIPMRPKGKTVLEIVELPPQRVVAKLEDPLNGSTVPDAELNSYYALPCNACPGSFVVGYKAAIINKIMFYSEPLIKGVFAVDTTPVPDGFAAYTLDGGRFVRISEQNPDGTPFLTREPGWEVEWPAGLAENGCNETPDPSRHCRMVQTGYGKHYELYVPIL